MDPLLPVVSDPFYGLPDLKGSDLFDFGIEFTPQPTQQQQQHPISDPSSSGSDECLSAVAVGPVSTNLSFDALQTAQAADVFTSSGDPLCHVLGSSALYDTMPFAQDRISRMPMSSRPEPMHVYPSFGANEQGSASMPACRVGNHRRSNHSSTLSASRSRTGFNAQPPRQTQQTRMYHGIDMNIFAPRRHVEPNIARLHQGFDKFVRGETLFAASKPVDFGSWSKTENTPRAANGPSQPTWATNVASNVRRGAHNVAMPVPDRAQKMTASIDENDAILALLNFANPGAAASQQTKDIAMTNDAAAASFNEPTALPSNCSGPSSSASSSSSSPSLPAPPPVSPNPATSSSSPPTVHAALTASLADPLLSTATILETYLPLLPTLLLEPDSELLLRCVHSAYGSVREIVAPIPDAFYRAEGLRKRAEKAWRDGTRPTRTVRQGAGERGEAGVDLGDMTEHEMIQDEKRKFAERVRKRINAIVREVRGG